MSQGRPVCVDLSAKEAQQERDTERHRQRQAPIETSKGGGIQRRPLA